MMDLKGKKLLLMGGGAFAKDIRNYANQTGFQMIAVGSMIGAHSKYADAYFQVDTTNVKEISDLIEQECINGIFVGASEVNIRPAIEIARRTGLPFYTSQKQWDILSNKRKFKDLLIKHGLPHIKEYDETMDPNMVEYPVIVKPVDGSGAHGISVCRQANELEQAIVYAKRYSFSGKVIIEQFLEGMDDTFIRYHLQEGVYSVSSSFDKYCDFSKGDFAGMPLIYVHPTRHLKAYLEKYDEKIKNLFRDIGLKNGVITLQGFVDQEERFFFYESGYRLGGSQSYLFTDAVNDSNSLHYMINYALTGQMADFSISKKDDPRFKKVCCNQYIPLKAGTIAFIEGLEKLRRIPGVLNITEMCETGTIIEETGDLNQICLRMHLIGDTREKLDELLACVDDTLRILDENGNDMRMCHIRSMGQVLEK